MIMKSSTASFFTKLKNMSILWFRLGKQEILKKLSPCTPTKLSKAGWSGTIQSCTQIHIEFYSQAHLEYKRNSQISVMRTFFFLLLGATLSLFVTTISADTDFSLLEHRGMCDASAAVAVGPEVFVVANDEDNIIRIYRNNRSGEALHSFDLSAYLHTDPKHPEADIEGAALIGNRIYWITSHGANKDGKQRPNRHRFFATDIKVSGTSVDLKPVGKPFQGLIKAFKDFDELNEYQLDKAARHAPESEHGLNIEGLTQTPDGDLLIGFRNPIPGGKALLVPLKNPDEVLIKGKSPKFGKPLLLSLNGRGIRSIDYSVSRKAYFIVAGPYDDDGTFQLYQWSGNPIEPPESLNIDFHDLHPEALMIMPGVTSKIHILSDDGSKKIAGKHCKGLTRVQDKSFRSLWIEAR